MCRSHKWNCILKEGSRSHPHVHQLKHLPRIGLMLRSARQCSFLPSRHPKVIDTAQSKCDQQQFCNPLFQNSAPKQAFRITEPNASSNVLYLDVYRHCRVKNIRCNLYQVIEAFETESLVRIPQAGAPEPQSGRCSMANTRH